MSQVVVMMEVREEVEEEETIMATVEVVMEVMGTMPTMN